ncbi:MAG: hypothetical protein NZ700_16090 [Gemmataceae bacterium]|nr:hypothetical protein [Gemmataceae bacterium]MDW8266071.1 hypothetical protein [Gemmataceae bacterium]
MRYVIAILLPPLGMLLCGRVFQAVLCLVLMLTLIAWPVASVWAALVVADYQADKRNARLLRALRKSPP